MYSTSDFRNGLKIQHDGEPYVIVEFQHVKPGKGGAFVRTKLKNLITGRVIDPTFRSGDKVEKPDVEEKDMDFLYHDGDEYVFMDSKTYEQLTIHKDHMGDAANWITENTRCSIMLYNGNPIGIELPNFLTLTITFCEPGIKGDTATGATKPATLETGATINVPLFINEGEKVKIDTRSGEYVERVS